MLAPMEVLHLEETSQVVEHEGQSTHYHYFDIVARKRSMKPDGLPARLAVSTDQPHNHPNGPEDQTMQSINPDLTLAARQGLAGLYCASMEASQDRLAATIRQANQEMSNASQLADQEYETIVNAAKEKRDGIVESARLQFLEAIAPAAQICELACQPIEAASDKLVQEAHEQQAAARKAAEATYKRAQEMALELYEVGREEIDPKDEAALRAAHQAFRAEVEAAKQVLQAACQVAERTHQEACRRINEQRHRENAPFKQAFTTATKAFEQEWNALRGPAQQEFDIIFKQAFARRESLKKAALEKNTEVCNAASDQFAQEQRLRVKAWKTMLAALEDFRSTLSA